MPSLSQSARTGAVTVRLAVKARRLWIDGASVKSTLEAALQDAAPDATSIVVEETGCGADAIWICVRGATRRVARRCPLYPLRTQSQRSGD